MQELAEESVNRTCPKCLASGYACWLLEVAKGHTGIWELDTDGIGQQIDHCLNGDVIELVREFRSIKE